MGPKQFLPLESVELGRYAHSHLPVERESTRCSVHRNYKIYQIVLSTRNSCVLIKKFGACISSADEALNDARGRRPPRRHSAKGIRLDARGAVTRSKNGPRLFYP